MATELQNEVRSELESRSTRTTLDELKRKGMEQVRVIRSSQILELIDRAVDRALAERGETPTPEDRSALLENSTEIFRQMMRTEMKTAQHEPDPAIDELRMQMQRQLHETAALEQRIAQRDNQLNEARSKAAELDAEVRVMRQRQTMGSPDGLLDELRALRKEIAKPAIAAPAPAPAPVADNGTSGALAALTSQIERIGRKVGVNAVEESPTDIAGLFTTIPDLESNLDSIEAEERKGSDVGDALARMKSLKKSRPKD